MPQALSKVVPQAPIDADGPAVGTTDHSDDAQDAEPSSRQPGSRPGFFSLNVPALNVPAAVHQ